MIANQEEYNLLKRQYDEAINKCGEWEYSLEGYFNEEQELDIISLVSYWSNQLNGFGHLNDEGEYKRICKEDVDGILYKEAKIGFEYSKKSYEIRDSIREWEIKNGNFIPVKI